MMLEKQQLSYILITPARNEAAYIENTIKCMLSQTVKPIKWIIVSDGSTDQTDEIIQRYSSKYSWIDYIRRPEHAERDFAAKVATFNLGYEQVRQLSYDIIGNLDADLTFDSFYFEFLLGKFSQDQALGIAGTPFTENLGQQYNYEFTNIEHVSGACQLFCRQCFEDIGGYQPIKGGGIDWVAVTTARMKGWKTRTFTEKTIFHHRKMGTGNGNIFRARFKLGKEDYYLGSHPLWEFLRCLFQMKSRPYILGGLSILAGYIWAFISGHERPISAELVHFYRKEQLKRLKKILV